MELPPTARWRTDRIELFPLVPEDVGAAYVGWLNDPTVNRFLESRFEHHTLDSTRAFVQSCVGSGRSLLLGIRALEFGGRHVGNIKLGPIDTRHGLGEVGILIGDAAARGRGLACSAIASLADIARDELGLRKLTAGCYAGNVASMRTFGRAGFEIEGRRRDHFMRDGQPEDLVLMGRWIAAPPATTAV